jgi:hypothetical protein
VKDKEGQANQQGGQGKVGRIRPGPTTAGGVSSALGLTGVVGSQTC